MEFRMMTSEGMFTLQPGGNEEHRPVICSRGWTEELVSEGAEVQITRAEPGAYTLKLLCYI